MSLITPFETVIDFWFDPENQAKWFIKDESFDSLIRDHFLITHQQAIAGELWYWRTNPLGRLAEIIVLDQFSRNIFRNQPSAFAYDLPALFLTQEAILSGTDKNLSQTECAVLYMPLMHSESVFVHENYSLHHFGELGIPGTLKYEKAHYDIIKQFGRYPHRNAILNRTSTPEEIEFLKTNTGF